MNFCLVLLLLAYATVRDIASVNLMEEKRTLRSLFINKKQLLALAVRNTQKTPVYRLKDFTVLFEFEASCSPSVRRFEKCRRRRLWFYSSQFNAANAARKSSGNPCCETTSVLVQPNTVTGVDTVTYEVVQDPDSIQVVHLGTCSSYTIGSLCSLSGFCTQEYRMQWILVYITETEKRFVPVEMHNHCVCNFV